MVKDFYNTSEEENKSIFNMALANLERLNSLINTFNNLMLSGDYNSAYRVLRQFKTCLSPEIRDSEEKELNDKVDNIGKKLKFYNQIKKNSKQRTTNELFYNLNEVLERLLKIMNKNDMLMPRKEDASHVMLR